METITITMEAAAQLLKIGQGEITTALKDGENLKPQDMVDAYVRDKLLDRVNAERREARDEGHGRGKRESLTAKEKEIRDRLNLEGATLDDMLDELQKRAEVKPDMTPDAVRKSEIYLADVKTFTDKVKAAEDETTKLRTDYKGREVMDKIKGAASEIFKKHNFVLPEADAIRANILKTIYAELSSNGHKVALNDAGDFVVLDNEGQTKMNPDTVQPISFEERFVAVSSGYLPTAKSDGRQSPMNQNGAGDGSGQGAGAGSYSFQVPESAQDYFEKLTAIKEPAERKAFKEFYIANGGE